MTAKHAVSHYPPRDWPCWTRAGYDAAGESNLYEGTSRESNSDKIEAYLDDWGGGNHRVGHRRWLLYPYLDAVGIGGTRTANVTHLFGSPFDEAAPNPQWVSWPTAGWFPSRLDPRGRWSLSSGADDTDFSSATVDVTYKGRDDRWHQAPHPRQRRRQADPRLGDARPRVAGQARRHGPGDGQRDRRRRRAGPGRGVHGPLLPDPLSPTRRAFPYWNHSRKAG